MVVPQLADRFRKERKSLETPLDPTHDKHNPPALSNESQLARAAGKPRLAVGGQERQEKGS